MSLWGVTITTNLLTATPLFLIVGFLRSCTYKIKAAFNLFLFTRSKALLISIILLYFFIKNIPVTGGGDVLFFAPGLIALIYHKTAHVIIYVVNKILPCSYKISFIHLYIPFFKEWYASVISGEKDCLSVYEENLKKKGLLQLLIITICHFSVTLLRTKLFDFYYYLI